MELGLLAIAAIPTTIGVWQSVEEGKKAKKEAADERRMQKFNLEVYCDAESEGAKEIDGKRVVMRGNKVRFFLPKGIFHTTGRERRMGGG